jgi:hypothetical protein
MSCFQLVSISSRIAYENTFYLRAETEMKII